MKLNLTVASLTAILGLNSLGCSGFQTKLMLSHGYGEYYSNIGKIPLNGVRIRHGSKEKSSGIKHQFGIDIYHGEPPGSSLTEEFNIQIGPFKQDISLDKVIQRDRIKIGIPLEIKLSSIQPNEYFSMNIYMGPGYNLNITTTKTDYNFKETILDHATIADIPGISMKGSLYINFTDEILLFKKLPLQINIRANEDGDVIPSFSGGYQINW